MLKKVVSKAAASEGPKAYPLGYVEGLSDARTTLANFFSFLLETQGPDVYNPVAKGMRAILPPRSSTAAIRLRAHAQPTLWDSRLASSVPPGGGLAQLGEHYVRNVGVGGSTPLPSTNLR